MEANVCRTIQQPFETPEVPARKATVRRMLVGAVYELKTSRVRFPSFCDSDSMNWRNDADLSREGPCGRRAPADRLPRILGDAERCFYHIRC